MKKHLTYLFWGAAFAFIISRSGATRFDYIYSMFLLEFGPGGHATQMFGIIGSAIAMAMPLLWMMRRLKKSGVKRFKAISFKERRLNPGTLPGAALFGFGWALTGTCPGPAMMQLGEGHGIAIATLAGIFMGQWIYGKVHARYFHWIPDICG